jgi:translation initiation factor 5B
MAPKKKGGKKQADDWENELGETADPIAQGAEEAKKAEADDDAAEEMGGGGGGLLAALRRNKDKRAKKGKQNVNDFVDGEDAESPAPVEPAADLAAKAPAEATFDDEDDDDVFAGNSNKKGKAGKKQPEKEAPAAADDDADGDGGVKSKKEKERERKEREKQRKKEQVSHCFPDIALSDPDSSAGREEERCYSGTGSKGRRSETCRCRDTRSACCCTREGRQSWQEEEDPRTSSRHSKTARALGSTTRRARKERS